MLNPAKTGRWIQEAFKRYIDSEMDDKSLEWAERNAGNIISGSTFSKCRRQSWYSFRDNRSDTRTKAFDWFSKRIMFMGHKSEDYIFDAIRKAQKEGRLTGVLHTDQLCPPVNITTIRTGASGRTYEFGSTTDGVVTDKLLWKGENITVHYPIELKQTDRPASSWWKRSVNKKAIRVYDGKATHKRQLIHWMSLAQLNGYIIPYGTLRYNRRLDYDELTWIFYLREFQDLVEDAFSDTDGQEYVLIEADMLIDMKRQEMENHVQDLESGTMPPQGTGLTSYDCDWCPYKAPCFASDGDPRKAGVTKLRTS